MLPFVFHKTVPLLQYPGSAFPSSGSYKSTICPLPRPWAHPTIFPKMGFALLWTTTSSFLSSPHMQRHSLGAPREAVGPCRVCWQEAVRTSEQHAFLQTPNPLWRVLQAFPSNWSPCSENGTEVTQMETPAGEAHDRQVPPTTKAALLHYPGVSRQLSEASKSLSPWFVESEFSLVSIISIKSQQPTYLPGKGHALLCGGNLPPRVIWFRPSL